MLPKTQSTSVRPPTSHQNMFSPLTEKIFSTDISAETPKAVQTIVQHSKEIIKRN